MLRKLRSVPGIMLALLLGFPGGAAAEEFRIGGSGGSIKAVTAGAIGPSSLALIVSEKRALRALKIDRAFIRHMATNADDVAIVSTVITLGHNLRLKVIAEGVETEEQSKFLRLLRCDEYQGYLFSKPVPADQVPALLVKP